MYPLLAVRCLQSTADLLLCKEGGDEEGKLRDAICTVACSTLQHTTQHTLSILCRRRMRSWRAWLSPIAAWVRTHHQGQTRHRIVSTVDQLQQLHYSLCRGPAIPQDCHEFFRSCTPLVPHRCALIGALLTVVSEPDPQKIFRGSGSETVLTVRYLELLYPLQWHSQKTCN